MLDLIIKNGTVVSADSVVNADVLVDKGKVVAIAKLEDEIPAKTVIDATNKVVIPGVVDPHVHYHLKFKQTATVDDFYSGGISAAIGGITTIIDFAIQEAGDTPMQTIEKRLAEAENKSVIDYALHACLTDPSDKTIKQIKDVIEFGIPSFKLFMVYQKQGWMVDDALLLSALKEAKAHGGLIGVHSENEAITEYNTAKALAEGNTSAIYHSITKPNLVELEAIGRAILLAKSSGAALYDFHMSIREGVEAVRANRKEGYPIYAETCSRYLGLTSDKLKGPNGINFICSPPLREQADIDALWQGINDGSISTIASDHCALSAENKSTWSESFATVPNGFEGVEYLLPVVFSEGVSKGRIDLSKLVAVLCTNPAKIFGLYPKKGVIAVGSDADIVVVDPGLEKVLSEKSSYLKLGWCPFEGFKVKGYPTTTISKGNVIVDKGKFVGKTGSGEFLKRSISEKVLQSPIC